MSRCGPIQCIRSSSMYRPAFPDKPSGQSKSERGLTEYHGWSWMERWISTAPHHCLASAFQENSGPPLWRLGSLKAKQHRKAQPSHVMICSFKARQGVRRSHEEAIAEAERATPWGIWASTSGSCQGGTDSCSNLDTTHGHRFRAQVSCIAGWPTEPDSKASQQSRTSDSWETVTPLSWSQCPTKFGWGSQRLSMCLMCRKAEPQKNYSRKPQGSNWIQR